MTRLRIVPATLAQANAYVVDTHRHNGRLPSAKFALAAVDEHGDVVGVAIAGLPKARMLCDGATLEISRVATDGSRNACSLLYGAAVRAAKALGYSRVVTYTLESEPGASLRASGWRLAAAGVGGDTWTRYKGNKAGLVTDYILKSRWEQRLTDPVEAHWPDTERADVPLFDVM